MFGCLALDDQHENCLIEIMVCCVREAATGEYPIGRGQPNRKVNSTIVHTLLPYLRSS